MPGGVQSVLISSVAKTKFQVAPVADYGANLALATGHLPPDV